ncbi:MAG: type III pantothenate kinase [Pseudomonadota bacterium]
MKLLFDIGNSTIKCALADGAKLIDQALTLTDTDFDGLGKLWMDGEAPEGVFAARVGATALTDALAQWTKAELGLPINFVTPSADALGLKTLYKDPEKLGVDRWLAAIAGFRLTDSNVCVVDIGTAITLDVVLGDGVHVGGLIAPGEGLIARALAQGTADLPMAAGIQRQGLALETRQAIGLGISEMIGGLLDRLHHRVTQSYPGLYFDWLITGGGGARCDWSGPAYCYVPDLVLQGLAAVAEESARA